MFTMDMELRFSISFLFDFKVYFSNEPICYFSNVLACCIYNVNFQFSAVQFSRSVMSNSATPWITACQASLSIKISRSSFKLTFITSVMPSSHLNLCRPLLLLPPIPPSIRIFSNESTLRIRWPKYWSFSFSIIFFQRTPRTDFL